MTSAAGRGFSEPHLSDDTKSSTPFFFSCTAQQQQHLSVSQSQREGEVGEEEEEPYIEPIDVHVG